MGKYCNKTIKQIYYVVVRRNIFKYPIAIVPLIFVTFILLHSRLGFYSFAYYHPRLPFWDLGIGINTVWPCFQSAGLNLFSLDPSTFPTFISCRNFNYGYFSVLSLGLLHSLNNNEMVWGLLQILVFLFLTCKIYFTINRSIHNYLNMLALFSPGVILLEISGNMDIQIICLLLIANIALASGKEKIALSIISLTALFKFYTAPVLLLSCFIVKRNSSRIYGLQLSFLTAIVISYQMFKTPIPSFPNGAQNKFGAAILGNYARKTGFNVSTFLGEIIGLVTLLFTLSVIFYCYKKFRINSNYSIKPTKELEILYINFVLMAVTSAVIYVAALNVDYRLTFIALSGIALFQLPQIRIKYISHIFPYVWLTSIWFAFPLVSLSKYIRIDLQPIGDLAMIITIAYLIFQSIFVMRQINHRA